MLPGVLVSIPAEYWLVDASCHNLADKGIISRDSGDNETGPATVVNVVWNILCLLVGTGLEDKALWVHGPGGVGFHLGAP
jgi:hypothetical protein